MDIRFYEIRVNALKKWEANTSRLFNNNYSALGNDELYESYECSWQNLYQEKHVHVFCSVGEWANNITDILQDNRYDYLNMNEEDEAKILFRYYTRLLLVVSELITDFQDIVIEFNSTNMDAARKILSGYNIKEEALKFDLSNKELQKEIYNAVNVLMDYINTVYKHKFGKSKQNKLHRFNNHLPIVFQSDQNIEEIFNYINLVSSRSVENVLVPNLDLILEIINTCYCQLNETFTIPENNIQFKLFCENNSK